VAKKDNNRANLPANHLHTRKAEAVIKFFQSGALKKNIDEKSFGKRKSPKLGRSRKQTPFLALEEAPPNQREEKAAW